MPYAQKHVWICDSCEKHGEVFKEDQRAAGDPPPYPAGWVVVGRSVFNWQAVCSRKCLLALKAKTLEEQVAAVRAFINEQFNAAEEKFAQ